jgi:hypothetical protein
VNRALALHVEMVTEYPLFHSSVPPNIFKQAASKDAASFLEVLGVLGELPCDPFAENIGELADFAVNFDFQQAADGLTALKTNRGGKSPPAFPTNFLSTWAARDADAAYAWFSKTERSPFETFGSFLDGIEKQGVPGSSSTWAANKLNEAGTVRDAMIRSLTEDGSDRLPTTINSIAQAMPDAASRDRFLGDVVTMSNLSEPVVTFSYALTQMSSTTARLETLQRLGKGGDLFAVNIPDSLLQQWGLTRQQVEQAQARGN